MVEKRFEICPATDLPPGERHIVTVGGISIGVFNVGGEYHAMKNDCPHQRAPLCQGKLGGTSTSSRPGEYNWERDGQIVRCPWHGWEFDVTTGESVFNPHQVKAKTFEATIEEPTVRTDGDGTATHDTRTSDCESCSVELQGEEPPVETYDVVVERGTVVVYL